PLSEWLEEREGFLSEFLCLEGKPLGIDQCQTCQITGMQQMYRCWECDGLQVQCRSCIIRAHEGRGLHFIEKWNLMLGFWEKTTLRELGHCYQLGHPIGRGPCPRPERSFAGIFTILDINGIHQITLDFCNCGLRQPHYVQLLRFGWFPVTVKFPRTAVTLRLLKFFQVLSFESKSTVYEFHRTIQRLTDNTGMKRMPDRNRLLRRAVREYRHLKLLKRAGRGHDPEGAQATSIGECAVLCPACPQTQKGRNLPDGFENVPPEKRFLYTDFRSIDANFRLKRRDISSEQADPSLSKGWSYFVEEIDYKAFLGEFDSKPSTCSNHTAVNNDHIAKPGLSASGCAVVDDARHGLKRPCSVGDLQKGERYVNMDYLFCSSMRNTELVEFVVSYDVACQWSINLWERLGKYPEWMRIKHAGDGKTVRFLVPKFHLPAHVRRCRTTFSFNYNRDVGRTDGEGVERGWSDINPAAASTKEMAPAARRETLDDHFGDFNWQKCASMFELLGNRIKEAVPEAASHREKFEDFTQGLSSDVDVAEWTAQLSEWEADHSNFNPYEITYKGVSLDAVARKFAEEEDAEEKKGEGFVLHQEVSASQLIIMGLGLEEDQQKLRVKQKGLGSHATDLQQTNWRIAANTLRRRLRSWIDIQHLYM
ncbi:hypothetical protein CPC08DRAFT_611227, partial [Agrocybe pediades]